MKFLKNIGIAFFLLAVLLLIINAATRGERKQEHQVNVPQKNSPIMTQAVEAAAPAVESFSNFTEEKFLEGMAGGKGPMADGARAVLAQKDRRELEANRGPRQTMKECIKPNGLIDQDVKMCMDGLIKKSW